MQTGYKKLKNNYLDIFDEEELKELIDEDNFNQDIIQRIKKQRNWSVIIWIALLIILFIIIEVLSNSSTADWIVDLFVKLNGIK